MKDILKCYNTMYPTTFLTCFGFNPLTLNEYHFYRMLGFAELSGQCQPLLHEENNRKYLSTNGDFLRSVFLIFSTIITLK